MAPGWNRPRSAGFPRNLPPRHPPSINPKSRSRRDPMRATLVLWRPPVSTGGCGPCAPPRRGQHRQRYVGPGHVKVNGAGAKPSTSVRAGDTVRGARRRPRANTRGSRSARQTVGAPVAATCFIDHSPPPPARKLDCRSAAPRSLSGPSDKAGAPRDRSPTEALTFHEVDAR